MTTDRNSDIETRKIPEDELEQYFTRFTRHFLIRDSTTSVEVEVLGSTTGDQFESEGAKIFGITYDPKGKSLEFELAGGDHRIVNPREVWTAEEPDGFVKAIEVVREDGVREVAKVKRAALTTPPSDQSAADTTRENRVE